MVIDVVICYFVIIWVMGLVFVWWYYIVVGVECQGWFIVVIGMVYDQVGDVLYVIVVYLVGWYCVFFGLLVLGLYQLGYCIGVWGVVVGWGIGGDVD